MFGMGQNYQHKISKSLQGFYAVNPTFKPLAYSKLNRQAEVFLTNLQLNTPKICPFGEPLMCARCDNAFDRQHYLLECPISRQHNEMLLGVLKDNEFNLEPDIQINIILSNPENHTRLLEFHKKLPPKYNCAGGHTVNPRKHARDF